MERQIVYNAIDCLDCGETIVSYHRHDYKTCGCRNQATVDGGNDYLRYGAVDFNKIKSQWIRDHTLQPNYIHETYYAHVIPAYLSLMRFALTINLGSYL